MIPRSLEYHLAQKMADEINKSPNNIIEVISSLARGSLVDELTGLYNRKGYELTKSIIKKSLDCGEIRNVGVIIFDLDGLKTGNDLYGHSWGDKLLTDAAAILQGSVRPEDNVFRVGGDELTLFLPNINDRILRERINMIKKNRDENRKDLFFSWGISFARSANELENAIKTADANMYKAKRARRK